MTHKNGCFNRAPFDSTITQQDGWCKTQPGGATKWPVLVETPHQMAKDCQYTHSALGQADKGCIGCGWRFSKQGVKLP